MFNYNLGVSLLNQNAYKTLYIGDVLPYHTQVEPKHFYNSRNNKKWCKTWSLKQGL
jgi:hypothetical protein